MWWSSDRFEFGCDNGEKLRAGVLAYLEYDEKHPHGAWAAYIGMGRTDPVLRLKHKGQFPVVQRGHHLLLKREPPGKLRLHGK